MIPRVTYTQLLKNNFREVLPARKLPACKKPVTSVIIPAYNQFDLTIQAIDSLIQSKNQTSYEVIVVDDYSSDGTCQIEDHIENLRVVRNPENLHFLRSCNRAAKVAKGDFIVLLNNDTQVTDSWLDELLLPFFDDKNVGMTGSMLIYGDGTLQEAGGIVWNSGQPWNLGRGDSPMRPEYNYRRDVDYLSGAALCIDRKVWEQVGGFSEEFMPCYYEDTDLAFKVRAAGYRTVYTPHSRVIHHEGQSNGTDTNQGSKRYQLINEPKFRAKWRESFTNNGEEGVAVHLHKDRNIQKRILVIDHVTPDPDADAGSYAAVQEMKLLQSLGFKVSFMPDNLAHMGKLTRKLQRMGVEVLYPPFYFSVHEAIAKRADEFDAFYITRYNIAEKYLPTIREWSAKKVLFNNADLHFLRELRMAQSGGACSEQAKKTRDRELSVIKNVDAVLSYNETEKAVILSHIGRSDHVYRCPWVVSEKSSGKPFHERSGIAFLGGYRHSPNVEAILWFVRDIMPLLIKTMPDLTLYIYGSHPTEEIKALASEHIQVTGFVENLDDVFHNHRLFIAPLLSGAGIKGKVLEAMAYGTPTVLTDIAAEATGLTHKISCWQAEQPAEWVEGITTLYQDESAWCKMAENSRLLAQNNFSFYKGKMAFTKIFQSMKII